MKPHLKTLVSWILGFAISTIFVRVIITMLVGRFDSSLWGYLIIPIALFAVPFYIIVKKNILK